MTYNVENLFDLKHDTGKNDYSFLPMTEKRRLGSEKHCFNIPVPAWKAQCLSLDWNRAALDTKMQRLADVITEKRTGGGPDILILQEVENVTVLRELSERFLSNEGYFPPILIEGSDYRGIDCAILSRFPLDSKAIIKPVPLVSFATKHHESIRGILIATFRIAKKELLTVFAVHFPSPQKSWKLRRQEMEYLNVEASKIPKNRTIIAAGDFNNSEEEELHFGLFRKYANAKWNVSHLQGCKQCMGTHFHESSRSWSFLDAIMVYRSNVGLSLITDSVHTVRLGPFHVDTKGRPIRFSTPDNAGVSDHLPIRLSIGPAKI